jgi:hypothetical protein
MARGTSGVRGAALLAAAVLALALALALGLAPSRALDGASAAPQAESPGPGPNLANRLLLRLPDLPPGYRLLRIGPWGLVPKFPYSECDQIDPTDPSPPLAAFVDRYRPRGCFVGYHRLFRVAGSGPAPSLVGSAAAELGSVEGAEAALAVAPELLAPLMRDIVPREAPSPETVGDATRLFRWQGPGLFASSGETISIVVWRSGGSVAIVLAADRSVADSDAAAFELARRQQEHLEAPTPHLPAEYDDAEVPLENPALRILRIPVYWLGRIYTAGGGLPRMRLADSKSNPRGKRGPRVALLYADQLGLDPAEAVQIDTWTRGQWSNLRGSGRPPFSLRCGSSRELDLPRGRAVLYRGAGPGYSTCRGPRRGRAHMAVVHVDGVVLVARPLSVCEDCFGPGDGPYDSFRGMAAIARGLERRLGGIPASGAPAPLAAPVARAAPGPNGKLLAGSEETVLRLHDLPPGYVIEGESDCEAWELTEVAAFKALDRWISENWPEGCRFQYERRFAVPGYGPTPFRVIGQTVNTPSPRAAAEGVETLSRLISRVTKARRRGTISIGAGGPTATVFHFRGRFGGDPEPVSSLLWHHGKLLAVIEVSGMTFQENDAAALHYAQIQQRRLEAPSPYTEAERDDTEVELDHPGLQVPVYWLGRAFDPGKGWGAAELQTANVVGEDGLPGVKVILRYDGFNIETWTRQGWERFQGSYLGKVNRPPCTRTTAFEWEHGHAVISAGYRRRTFDEGCPSFPPTRYWAVAHVGGVVIGVNQTTCRCLSPGSGPYSSTLRGMKTILRGLTLRPKTTY